MRKAAIAVDVRSTVQGTLLILKSMHILMKQNLAMKMYYSDVSGRDVGKISGMNKANVYNWIKNKP